MTDWNGFYPDGIKCTSCGAPLGGHKNGPGDYDHPGENYAGTATGLCDKCTMMSGFVVSTEWDGARHISYPPDCPSWRRDRTVQIAYADCETCQGLVGCT
jgi:hypothetical protein